MDRINFEFIIDLACDADRRRTSILAKHFGKYCTLNHVISYAECEYYRGLALGWVL